MLNLRPEGSTVSSVWLTDMVKIDRCGIEGDFQPGDGPADLDFDVNGDRAGSTVTCFGRGDEFDCLRKGAGGRLSPGPVWLADGVVRLKIMRA